MSSTLVKGSGVDMNGQVNFAITSPCSYNDAKVLLAITPSGIDAWPRYWPIISILHLKYSCCHPWSRGFNSRRRLILQSHTCLKSKVSIKNSITNNNYTFQNYSLLPQNQALLLKNQDLLLAKIASIEEAIRDRLPNGKFGARDVVFAKMLKERPAIVISHSALTLLKRCKNSLSRLNIAFYWRTSAWGLSMKITCISTWRWALLWRDWFWRKILTSRLLFQPQKSRTSIYRWNHAPHSGWITSPP